MTDEASRDETHASDQGACTLNSSRSAPPRGKSRTCIAQHFGLFIALLALACDSGGSATAIARAAFDANERETLVALARLEPGSRVVNVGSSSPGIVKEILVQDGNAVERDQILVILDSHPLRLAELEAARLQQQRASLMPLEVEAQTARLRAIQAELKYARNEVGSQQGLSEKGFSAGKEFRDAKLRVRRAEEEVNEAEAVLHQLRATVAISEREAANGVLKAEVTVEQTLIRSPLEGQVLRVRVREGERIDGRPVVSVGATKDMYAVAEVHANDIRLVEAGQRAQFTSPALSDPIDGRVETVGEMIFGNGITGEDPSAPRGLRVVEVRVRLEDNVLARRLTNLEGQLRIFLDDTAAR
jgi:HlyD family secretion protein